MKKEKTTIGPDENGRYYYKSVSGKGFMNLKSPLNDENYVEITKEEFDTLTYVAPHEPTAEEIAAKERAQEIAQLKSNLSETDYVAAKLAEAVAKGAGVADLLTEYAEVLENRESWRTRINELEGDRKASCRERV